MSLYKNIFQEATGVQHPDGLAAIEECVRHDIFRSTLDWQTREMLEGAGREALEALKTAGMWEHEWGPHHLPLDQEG